MGVRVEAGVDKETIATFTIVLDGEHLANLRRKGLGEEVMHLALVVTQGFGPKPKALEAKTKGKKKKPKPRKDLERLDTNTLLWVPGGTVKR